MRAFATKQTEWAPVRVSPEASRRSRGFLATRYSTADQAGVAAARRTVLRALDRLEAELDGDDYLAGDAFSVADPTAAALFYPVVLREEGPWQPVRTKAFLELQDSVRHRPGFRWVEETFRRHRRNSGV